MTPRKPTRAKALTCKRCGEKKDATLFSLDRSRASTTRFPWCKSCVGVYRIEKRPIRHTGTDEKLCLVCLAPIGGTHANRAYCSDSCKDKARRWRTFGLSPAEYRQLLEAQGGKCVLCRKNVKRWALDHNHNTGETMGITCSICNHQLLAFSFHDVEIARRLVTFLESPPTRMMFGERRYVGPESLSQLHRMWAWSGEPES